MTARYFTSICLATTCIAMAAIAAMNYTTQPAHSVIIDESLPCIYDTQQRCAR